MIGEFQRRPSLEASIVMWRNEALRAKVIAAIQRRTSLGYGAAEMEHVARCVEAAFDDVERSFTKVLR